MNRRRANVSVAQKLLRDLDLLRCELARSAPHVTQFEHISMGQIAAIA
jgi:hypothetical protein